MSQKDLIEILLHRPTVVQLPSPCPHLSGMPYILDRVPENGFLKSHQIPKRYFALSTHIVKFDYFMLVIKSVTINRAAKKD